MPYLAVHVLMILYYVYQSYHISYVCNHMYLHFIPHYLVVDELLEVSQGGLLLDHISLDSQQLGLQRHRERQAHT
jgi:hypothetical protein